MALEVTFFFPPFFSFIYFFCRLIYARLLWFRCSRTCSGGRKKKRQSYTKGWNEKAVWGDTECQVTSAAGMNTNVFFPLYLNLSSVSRCRGKRGRGDGESEPRYGTVARAPAGTAGVVACYFSVRRGEEEGALIWLLSVEEIGTVRAEWRASPLLWFFTPARVWLKIRRDQSC